MWTESTQLRGTLQHAQPDDEPERVAVIVRHTGADSEGTARAIVEPSLLDLSPTHEVILLGRVSGTCIVGPAAPGADTRPTLPVAAGRGPS